MWARAFQRLQEPGVDSNALETSRYSYISPSVSKVTCHDWIPDIKTFREAVFSGHFGPIGVGAWIFPR
jgi:hypothetical protein